MGAIAPAASRSLRGRAPLRLSRDGGKDATIQVRGGTVERRRQKGMEDENKLGVSKPGIASKPVGPWGGGPTPLESLLD
eukprot:1557251-Pyramimonas_sp.AAC.2